YETSGGELIMGSGRFVAPKTLEVRLNDGGTRLLVGDQVFLIVGTHARGADRDVSRPAVSQAARRHSRASDDGGGPRLAVRERAASRCPTDHTKTERPALIVRSRSDVRARYSLAEGGWAIGRMRVGLGLNSLFSPRWARWARLVSKGFDHERNARRGCSQSGIAG